jgi:hypothetical protein
METNRVGLPFCFFRFTGAIVVLILHKAKAMSSVAGKLPRPAIVIDLHCGTSPDRVDTLFFHDGVGKLEWFGFRLDIEPYVFTMDIGLLLQREAHHHPVTCTAKSLCSVTGISFNHSHFFCSILKRLDSSIYWNWDVETRRGNCTNVTIHT